MEDKTQLLGREQPLEGVGRKAAQRSCCLPDQPITRLLDSAKCRECLGALTHRLAQPVTALRGGIEIGLMGKRSAADYRNLLEQSLQLADNIAQLIISLRDLAESGTPGRKPGRVLLEPTITEVLTELEDLAQVRDLRLQLTSQVAVEVCANPERLREALQSFLAWVIENSAGGGVIDVELSASSKEACVFVSPSRLDFQYLQIKMLEDITTPGLLFAHAAKYGALGWAINQRLWGGLGGKMEILTEGPDTGCIRVSLPRPPQAEVKNLS